MEELNELEHVCRCLIEIRKSQEAVMKRFGFMTYRAFAEAKERVLGAIPEKGIEIDGYKIYPTKRNIYAVAGGKSIGQITKIRTTKI